MTTRTEDRVRLAEAMGYVKRPANPDADWSVDVWEREDSRRSWYIDELPNPYTKPADRDALVGWLVKQGFYVFQESGRDYAKSYCCRISKNGVQVIEHAEGRTPGEAVTRAALRVLDEMEGKA